MEPSGNESDVVDYACVVLLGVLSLECWEKGGVRACNLTAVIRHEMIQDVDRISKEKQVLEKKAPP